MKKQKILVIDDDTSILMLLSDVLSENGFEVETASSGEDGIALIQKETFDMILLDIMMKGISGLDVCRRIRSSVSCPILFLSAKDTSKDIINGLELGADDYLTKPFVLDELVARINAHLRRESRAAVPQRAPGLLQIGDITLDQEDMSVEKDGTPVQLSTREFELLAYLMQNAGHTLSREKIFHDVWKTDYGDVGAVAINIKNLRSKIDPSWQYIKTVWGSGYRFVTQSSFVEEKAKGATNHEKKD
ncbi:MAG: response regulator transcription factor [Oscillospiraceae bacterium]|jgi:DNA-binding response OmpR family regulator|nr:response regulator transcription factor [Oscillospiraceae bacterium]MDD3262118.1 response regulator transcription factor [Oscillospiraceae bacterium]